MSTVSCSQGIFQDWTNLTVQTIKQTDHTKTQPVQNHHFKSHISFCFRNVTSKRTIIWNWWSMKLTEVKKIFSFVTRKSLKKFTIQSRKDLLDSERSWLIWLRKLWRYGKKVNGILWKVSSWSIWMICWKWRNSWMKGRRKSRSCWDSLMKLLLRKV